MAVVSGLRRISKTRQNGQTVFTPVVIADVTFLSVGDVRITIMFPTYDVLLAI